MLESLLEAAQPSVQMTLAQDCWGFGGVHGGLSVALLLAAMRGEADGLQLRQVNAQFHKALREPFVLSLEQAQRSRSLTWVSATALQGDQAAVSTSALFSAAFSVQAAPLAPVMPTVAAADHCPVFVVPPAFVPFAPHLEIRPADSNRPFAGGTQAQLCAWVRLVDDDKAPDAARLAILLDALAPSYAAVLRMPAAMPTVTFSFTPGAGLAEARSPWVLLLARTEVQQDGWLLENIDAWSPQGQHLGSAQQLRLWLNR